MSSEPPIPFREIFSRYVGVLIVVGIPLAALFLKRGWSQSLEDGEVILFSGTLNLAASWDIATHKMSGLSRTNRPILFISTLAYLIFNLCLLGLSSYYVVVGQTNQAQAGVDWLNIL